MAGGSGTRFWPKSTSKRPKQLLGFGSDSDETLLTRTLSRFDGVVAPNRRLIVTTELLSDAVSAQSGKSVKVLAEPQGRNSAPAIYWAAREVAKEDPEGILLVMSSDHHIGRPEKFVATVREAIEWARTHDDLVALGVRPDRPETGYGYLKKAHSGNRVEAFVEKPNLEKAKSFLAAGNYLWNGGMFVWRASVILKAFDEFMPEYGKAWDAAAGKVGAAYPKMTATSIDYGVMEKARNVVTFELDCGWDDLGSWTSLENLADELRARAGENVVTGGELVAVDSKRNIVDAPERLVALLGVEDLIVVQQGEAILVARKDRAQDIRLVVEQVKQRRPDLA